MAPAGQRTDHLNGADDVSGRAASQTLDHRPAVFTVAALAFAGSAPALWAKETIRKRMWPSSLWTPMNGWIFAICLILLIIVTIAALVFICTRLYKGSNTRGDFNLKMCALGLGLLMPCVMYWIWQNSVLDQAARDHLVPLTFFGDADPDLASVGGLLFFFFLILSVFVASCLVVCGVGLLTSDTSVASGRTTVTTRYLCPHCGTKIKPFDFPLRGQGRCRACGRVFRV